MFPTWPDEAVYNATGYGPYPFWAPGTPNTGSMTEGAPIQSWFSALQNSERLDHNGECQLEGLGPDLRSPAEIAAGVAPRAPRNGPCTHLFVGERAWLFSQDRAFCCRSSTPNSTCHLTRPQKDFWRAFKLQGVSDYTSESGYYQGKVKNYTMSLSKPWQNFWFWYVTDMHDRPIEQGEGPCVSPRGCNHGPKYLFHQYNPRTFRAAAVPPSVFDVPEVCTGRDVQDCLVGPITSFCTGR